MDRTFAILSLVRCDTYFIFFQYTKVLVMEIEGLIYNEICIGDVLSIRQRLQSGMDPNICVATGFGDQRTSIFGLSIQIGYPQMAHLLLNWKADVDWKSVHTGSTAIHLTAQRSSMVSVTERLIESKGDVNRKNSIDEVPLIWALHGGILDNDNSDNVELLLMNGADVNFTFPDNLMIPLIRDDKTTWQTYQRLCKWLSRD